LSVLAGRLGHFQTLFGDAAEKSYVLDMRNSYTPVEVNVRKKFTLMKS
jgi:hypothetical protein